MITVSKEDYLKAILEAESEGESVISARLADWLKVSAPAVTMAVRRLKKDALVRVHRIPRRANIRCRVPFEASPVEDRNVTENN